jgi:hypothetical protein
MRIVERRKYEMFVRVSSFGTSLGDVLPEGSAGARKFAKLAEVVASIEGEFVRLAQARVDARKLHRGAWDSARRAMRAFAATGRRAAQGETTPHAFRMPRRKAAVSVLIAARELRTEAERRRDLFVELGMPPTFLADYDAVVGELADAVTRQQDSRGGRRRAGGALGEAFREGTAIVADLDVTVPNALGPDRVRLAAWAGARRIDRARSPRGGAEAAPALALAPVAVHEVKVIDAQPPVASAPPLLMIAAS